MVGTVDSKLDQSSLRISIGLFLQRLRDHVDAFCL